MRLAPAFAAFAVLASLHSASRASSALSSGATGKLETALNAVSVEQIKKDIFHIASDEMAGRDTPSAELKEAARFIAARLEKLGFEHGAQGGWFYEYPLYVPQLDAGATALELERGTKSHAFKFGEDYFFSARRMATQENSGEIVLCGQGGDQDFAGAEGKWALVFDVGQGALGVEKNARQAGAIGLVYVPGDGYSGKAYPERFASQVAGAKTGRAQWPPKRDGSSASDGEKKSDLAILYLTRDAAAKLGPLERLERADASGKKPAIEGTLRDKRKLAGEDGLVQVENVCGFWRGSDPVLSKEVLIVSAHYDHVGYGGTKEIHNGADDNGSGTTGLLAIASALEKHGPMRRSVLLLWVSGEEKGLFGSQAWTEKPWLPEGCKPVCDINIDMIGRNAADYLLITPTSARKEYNGLVKLAEANAPLEGFPKLGSCDSYWSRSDHANFAQNLKIPVTFLFSDVHEDYHKPGDDPEKIDCDKIRRVSRLVVRMLDGLQSDVLDL